MTIFLTLIYAFFIGFYNVFKKLSMRKSNASVVLAIFTSICFLLSLIWIPFGVAIPWNMVWIFVLKGFIISLSWYITLRILKNADLSLVIATNILSTVLTFVVGTTIFGETVSMFQIVGSVIIVTSVALINVLNKKQTGKVNMLHLGLLLLTALFSTGSEVIDKYTTTYLTNFQVQFWFLLFVCLFSWIFFAIECSRKKEFLIKKQDFKNNWIYLVAILLFFGDLMLFLAYRQPGSQMIIISIISKLKIIVTMFAGVFIFKEKDVGKKIMLTISIVIGTILISLF